MMPNCTALFWIETKLEFSIFPDYSFKTLKITS